MDAYDSYNAILHSGNRSLYQLAVLSSMIVGGALIRYDSRNWPLSTPVRYTIITAAAIGSLVGCAIPAFFAGGYVGASASDYLLSPKTVLGGILCSFFAVALVKRILHVSYDTSDAFARGGCLMMAIGRLGCVAQHCCFGVPTESSLGVRLGDGVSRFPVQAIEASLMFLLFAGLHVCHRMNYFQNRRLFILFASYGFLRYWLEFLRENIASEWLGIGFYQWIALSLFVVGVYQIVVRTKRLRMLGKFQLPAAEAIE
jgi:prolipoprotein diacylglyceryltransferase